MIGEEARTVIGARPGHAVVVEDKDHILKNFKNMTKSSERKPSGSLQNMRLQMSKLPEICVLPQNTEHFLLKCSQREHGKQ